MNQSFGGFTPTELVTSLYQAYFDRDLDPGAADKIERLERGEASTADIIAEIVNSEEYAGRQPQARLLNDQTQYGELELLLKRWTERAAPNTFVVDVGARGKARSNSWDLLTSFGWRGVLIEANPALIPSIQQDFAGLDIRLVQCAISDYEGEAEFHIGVNDDVSSLDEDASASWGPTAGTVAVRVRRLGDVLRELDVPIEFSLLSLDIEGHDIRVLNDVVGRDGYRPSWVIIEASYDFSTRSLADLPLDPIVAEHYDLVGQTAANLILERRQ